MKRIIVTGVLLLGVALTGTVQATHPKPTPTPTPTPTATPTLAPPPMIYVFSCVTEGQGELHIIGLGEGWTATLEPDGIPLENDPGVYLLDPGDYGVTTVDPQGTATSIAIHIAPCPEPTVTPKPTKPPQAPRPTPRPTLPPTDTE